MISLKTLAFSLALGVSAFAETPAKLEKPVSLPVEERLAAEHSRAQFFELQAQLLQLQQRVNTAAQDASDKLGKLSKVCTDAKQNFDSNALACIIPASSVEEKK